MLSTVFSIAQHLLRSHKTQCGSPRGTQTPCACRTARCATKKTSSPVPKYFLAPGQIARLQRHSRTELQLCASTSHCCLLSGASRFIKDTPDELLRGTASGGSQSVRRDCEMPLRHIEPSCFTENRTTFSVECRWLLVQRRRRPERWCREQFRARHQKWLGVKNGRQPRESEREKCWSQDAAEPFVCVCAMAHHTSEVPLMA